MRRRTVALPQFVAMHAVICAEVQRPVVYGERIGTRSFSAISDVFDQRGVCGGAISLPELVAMDTVVGIEIEPAIKWCEVVRSRATRTPIEEVYISD